MSEDCENIKGIYYWKMIKCYSEDSSIKPSDKVYEAGKCQGSTGSLKINQQRSSFVFVDLTVNMLDILVLRDF